MGYDLNVKHRDDSDFITQNMVISPTKRMVLKPRDMEGFDSEKIGMQPSKMVFFSHQT